MLDLETGNVSYGLQIGHSELAVDRRIRGRELFFRVPALTQQLLRRQTAPWVAWLNMLSSSMVSWVAVDSVDANSRFPRPKWLYLPHNAPSARRDPAPAGAEALPG